MRRPRRRHEQLVQSTQVISCGLDSGPGSPAFKSTSSLRLSWPSQPSAASWEVGLLEGRTCGCGIRSTWDTELCLLPPQATLALARVLTMSQRTWGVPANRDPPVPVALWTPALPPAGGVGGLDGLDLFQHCHHTWPRLPSSGVLPRTPDRSAPSSPLSQKMRPEAPVPAGPRSLTPTGRAVGVEEEASWKK